MLESKKCPYCNEVFPLIKIDNNIAGTKNDYFFNLFSCSTLPSSHFNGEYHLIITKCPNCQRDTITIEDNILNDNNKKTVFQVKPNAIYNKYPDYIPKNIISDYEEACAIIHISPKASATLSRRCLQGMIRDFWGIKENRLIDEICALKDIISPLQWKAVDALRSLGNIAAHMEKDVNCIVDIDDEEAEKLIKLIEFLINQWYINRYEQETVYNDLIRINEDKKSQKKSADFVSAQE